MEVTFSINLDLSKKEQNKKHNMMNSCCGCGNESTLEKWLDTAQKFVKTMKVK